MTTKVRIEAAARTAHEAIRFYDFGCGIDPMKPSWASLPTEHQKRLIEGVQAIVDDPSLTPERQHERWVACMARDGWTFGHVKDDEQKTHPCMCPYDELPIMQQAKDVIFQAIVRGMLGVELTAS
jgi:hypothetical protein